MSIKNQNDQIIEGMFSSNKQDYETPDYVYEYFNKRFKFTVDVCAHENNHKHQRYFSPEQDGLKQSWQGEVFWMNPPYTTPEQPCKKVCTKKKCAKREWHTNTYIPGQIDWVKKAVSEVVNGGARGCGLLPARTDTEIFHHFVMDTAREVYFIEGRLVFEGGDTDPAPFPSMIVYWDNPMFFTETIFRSISVEEMLNEFKAK